MSWMIPRNKFDGDQNHFLDLIATRGKHKNYWISGFAGSGKSVLIVAALQQVLTDTPEAKVCVVVYTHSLVDLIRTGIPKDLGDIPVMTYFEFRKDDTSYDLILVDEVQDLPASDLEAMRRQSERVIVAGDVDQSIYENRIPPEKIEEVAEATRYSLTFIHRLPRNVVTLVDSLFPERNLSDAKLDRLARVQPRIGRAEKREEEVAYVWKKAKQYAAPGSPPAILLPSHRQIVHFVNEVLMLEGKALWQVQRAYKHGKRKEIDYDAMHQHLRSQDVKLRFLGKTYGSLQDAEDKGLVFVTTYHSVKGLDFAAVFVPWLHKDATIWRRDEQIAKTLFYVALTRSRRDLYLTYTGEPHPFLEQIPTGPAVHRVSIPEPVQPTHSSDGRYKRDKRNYDAPIF